MVEVVILIISVIMVFLKKGLFFGLGFLVIDWFVVGNIVRSVFGDNGKGYFVFSVVTLALGYYCAYMMR